MSQSLSAFLKYRVSYKKDHLQEVLNYYFIWKKTNAPTYRVLVEIYGEDAPSQDTCERWLNRFKTGDFDVKDKTKGKPWEKIENVMQDEYSTRTLFYHNWRKY